MTMYLIIWLCSMLLAGWGGVCLYPILWLPPVLWLLPAVVSQLRSDVVLAHGSVLISCVIMCTHITFYATFNGKVLLIQQWCSQEIILSEGNWVGCWICVESISFGACCNGQGLLNMTFAINPSALICVPVICWKCAVFENGLTSEFWRGKKTKIVDNTSHSPASLIAGY